MMSVFKFPQALALADYMHHQKQPLKTRLLIKKSDLKPDTYSPLRETYPQGGIEMSIADLLKYTLQQSDNNACDILFNYQGGPDAVNKYLQFIGNSVNVLSSIQKTICMRIWSSVTKTGLLHWQPPNYWKYFAMKTFLTKNTRISFIKQWWNVRQDKTA